MEIITLKDFIKELQHTRKEYKEQFGVEPHIWSLRAGDGEVELCPDIRDTGYGHKMIGKSEIFNISEISDL